MSYGAEYQHLSYESINMYLRFYLSSTDTDVAPAASWIPLEKAPVYRNECNDWLT